MVLRKRIVARPSARRPLTEPRVTLATCHWSRAASVSESPDAVRLRIQASGEIAPGSVEVRFAGRKAVVLARDAAGRAIRSQRVRLPAPVVEEGASADYDAEDTLVMTLRKQAAAQAAAPPGDPEAAAR